MVVTTCPTCPTCSHLRSSLQPPPPQPLTITVVVASLAGSSIVRRSPYSGYGVFEMEMIIWVRDLGQCVKTMGENVGWDAYKEAIIQRFGLVFEDPMADLKNVKYDKTAKEY
ncbi:hypothetical protein Tco_0699285 [Tanacetum coccineum]